MNKNSNKRRCGAIAHLAALMMMVLVALVAFAVDIGWIGLVQSDLQNAADAAALAGVNTLMDPLVQYNLPGQTAQNQSTILSTAQTTARAKAKEYAQYNAAGGVASLTLLDSDIEFGFTDSSNKYTPSPAYTGFPNTVKVTLRRDSTANGELKLFFGPAIGRKTESITASAAATLYSGTISSFNIRHSPWLPITFDVNHWNNFLATGQSPDGTTLTDASGNPEIQLYPSNQYKGNLGQISLDNSNIGASTEVSWVNSGLTSSNVQNLIDSKLIPLASHVDAWDWQGSSGTTASLNTAINNKVGSTFIIPLFKPVNSTAATYQAGVSSGSNYAYNIVQFVAVKVVVAKTTNKQVFVEPGALTDPSFVLDPTTIVPAGTSTTFVTTFATPKLTQ